MNKRPIRGVYLDVNFLKWPSLRSLQRKNWSQSTDWFLTCVSLARDALNGGRIEIGGEVLSPEEIADHMPSIKGMAPFDESWLKDAVDSKLLEMHPDNCYCVPNWSLWHEDRSNSINSLLDSPAWSEFLDNWHEKHGESLKIARELVEFAESAGIRFGSSSDKTPTAKKNWLSKMLGEAAKQAPRNGLAIYSNSDGNVKKYCLKRIKS